MSIVLPSVLNLTEQNADKFIQDGELSIMHAVNISKVYCCYLGGRAIDVLLAYNSSSMMKVF